MPIVMLKNNTPGQHVLHLAVLQQNAVFGFGRDRYVRVKNSDGNEPTIEVKLNLSPNSNGWSLAAPSCFYIEFN